MDVYSNSEVQPPRARAADELASLRAKVGQLERRLREEGHMRQALRRQLARRQVFETRLAHAIPAALYFQNLITGAETFLNDYLAQALGYTPATLRPLKPRVLEALLHPLDKIGLQQYYTQVRCAPVGASAQYEVRLRSASGIWQRVKLQHTVFLSDAQGCATHLLGSALLLATHGAADAASNVLADMSHEIKTPLHAIVGLAQLLRSSPANLAHAAHLDALLANAENLLSITTTVLTEAQLQAGNKHSAEATFDALAVVQRAVQSMTFAAQAKGLALHLKLPATPLPALVGAASRLTQVVVNLLGNAIKFTEAGHITVSVSAAASLQGSTQLTLCVADTGIGIGVDKAEQVFQRFAQASEKIAQRYGGNGLGLAICKELVERQGGRIWFESELGKGSQFYCSLPYVSRLTLPAPVAPPIVPGLLKGLRVLLVEDNEIGALLATTLLQTWHIAADVACNGEQALDLALAQPYDVILMDVHLPHLRGVEVATSLRNQSGLNQDTPIIALTAETGTGNNDAWTSAKFTGWLEKPYTEAQLHFTLATHTGRDHEPVPAKGAHYGFASFGKLAHDTSFVSKMQRLFVETVPLRLAQLEAIIARQDWAAAHPLVHSLKTTYSSMQMEEAMGQLQRMEEILKNNPTRTNLSNVFHFLQLATSKTAKIFENQLETAA